MATKIHKGLLAECPVCTGFQPERKFKRKRTGVADTSARRQANMELGEDPTRIKKDAVFMKYGLLDPIIDRNVRKPFWKSEVVWQREMKQFVQDTAGMVPRQRFQESRRGYTPRTFFIRLIFVNVINITENNNGWISGKWIHECGLSIWF